MSEEKSLQTHYPCNVCGEVAIGCFRPDPDIKGLCFCNKHREEVFRVYTLLLTLNDDSIALGEMKDWKHK